LSHPPTLNFLDSPHITHSNHWTFHKKKSFWTGLEIDTVFEPKQNLQKKISTTKKTYKVFFTPRSTVHGFFSRKVPSAAAPKPGLANVLHLYHASHQLIHQWCRLWNDFLASKKHQKNTVQTESELLERAS